MKTDLQDLSLSHLSHRHVCDIPVLHACMQCAAKASSMESARQSDGTRRKSSQIECFSVQVVRCSGASVEEGVHMHQAAYHVKKSLEKCSEQRRLLITSSSRPSALYLQSFFGATMSPTAHRIAPRGSVHSEAPVHFLRSTSLSIREAPSDGFSS